MPLTIRNCVLSYKQQKISENGLILPRNYFHNRIARQQLFATQFLTGGKWDFQVANLLLATANFEPCSCIFKTTTNGAKSENDVRYGMYCQ